MKPRKNYRMRPKKLGAKKTQKVQAQKRKLIAAGHQESELNKMNTVGIRELLKFTASKKGIKAMKAAESKVAA